MYVALLAAFRDKLRLPPKFLEVRLAAYATGSTGKVSQQIASHG